MTDQSTDLAHVEREPMVALIERFTMNPDIDVAKLEKLLDMHERMQEREARRAFACAFSQMQAEFPEIEKRGEIKHSGKLQSTYARWEDINAVIKPVLSKFGFSLSFRTATAENAINLTAVLRHEDGHEDTDTISLPFDTSGSKNAVQARGSTVSYGKRYTAINILNLSARDEDDDGQGSNIGTIAPEQFIRLRDRIEEVGADEGRLLAFFRASSLEQFPASKLPDAFAMLDRKAKENA